MYSQKDSAIQKMNSWGKAKIPFLFIIDFLSENPLIFPLNEINKEEILFDLNGFKNYSFSPKQLNEIVFKKYPLNLEEYTYSFQKAIQHIHYGNSYLLNLSAPTPIECNLSLKEIFYNSLARYKIYFKDSFVCFSPEIFVQIQKQKIASYPMKGTIDASLPNAEKTILADKKELAEHTTIVDLIRNDLSIVAKNVRVERFRYVEEIITLDKKLLQVSSEIVGDLSKNYGENIGTILFQLLPAGSISGAPKQKTLEIIVETENYNRGYYTGIVGYFDGTQLDSGVLIRFIEKIEDKLYFKSGGGITAFSNPEAEYAELIDKVYLPIPQNE